MSKQAGIQSNVSSVTSTFLGLNLIESLFPQSQCARETEAFINLSAGYMRNG